MITCTIDNLKRLEEYSKALKCDFITVRNNMIYGTDLNFTHLKSIQFDILGEITFYMKDLIEFNKTYFDNNNPFDDLNISIFQRPNDRFISLIDNVYFNYLHYPVLYTEENLKSNDNFNQINGMKTVDGMGLLKLNDKYILSMFNGMIPVNKSDKLQLRIHDIDEYRYLANFIIDKKKFVINAYFMYLFLK